MKVKLKKLHPSAVAPKFGKPGDAGADLVATSVDYSRENQVVYGTGIAVEIPEGMVGLVFPRSSVRNYNLAMSNSVGVIDSGYRGEVMVTFNVTEHDLDFVTKYHVGDRVAQLIIIPVPFIEYLVVEELSETERGAGGHGSTGK